MKIILASQSLGRKKLLSQLGLKFEVIPSNIDESKVIAPNPKLLVQKIAKKKAEVVANNVVSSQPPPLIIAADSMVVLEKEVVGKPKDKKEAVKILQKLSGKTHKFITGVCVLTPKSTPGVGYSVEKGYSETMVTFRKMTDQEIKAYLKRTSPARFAGGYSILDPQDFITKIEGSLTNVIGLPLEIVLPILREYGLFSKEMEAK